MLWNVYTGGVLWSVYIGRILIVQDRESIHIVHTGELLWSVYMLWIVYTGVH